MPGEFRVTFGCGCARAGERFRTGCAQVERRSLGRWARQRTSYSGNFVGSGSAPPFRRYDTIASLSF